MSETKKRAFTLELTDKETTAFIEMCFRDGTTPAEVLEGFICDLTEAERTRGSDERMLATQYYERCGYGFFLSGEYRTFAQWLLEEYRLNDIAEALDDIKDLEEEVQYLTDHPDEVDEGELESLGAQITDCKEDIETIYQEYTAQIKSPDTLEDGLKGVREYLETIEKAKEGGAI